MAEERKLYSTSGDEKTADIEAKRLQAMQFPDKVSQSLIGDPNGMTIIDFGSGPSGSLGLWVESFGGTYIGFDIDPKLLIKHSEFVAQKTNGAPAKLAQADVRNTWPVKASRTIGHVRFVLEHLQDADLEAIRGALNASDKTIFIEYDYTNAGGDSQVEEFLAIAKPFLNEVLRVDTEYGAKLEDKVVGIMRQNAISGQVIRADFDYEDPEGYGLMAVMTGTAGIMARMGRMGESGRVAGVREKNKQKN